MAFETNTRTAYPPSDGLDRIQAIIAEGWICLSEQSRRLLILASSYIVVEIA